MHTGIGGRDLLGPTEDSRSAAVEAPLGYWIEIPLWLWVSPNLLDQRAPPLVDLLWAQECVIWAVRLRDDLLDGQSEAAASGLTADLLLLEAESTLDRAAGSRALESYRQALATTQRAIVEVRNLQCRAEGMPAESLALYSEVNEVFKLASAVLLGSLDRSPEMSAVGSFCDHLGVAGQILDDLEDLEEDLAAGRLNWVASRMLDSEEARRSPADDRAALLGRALARGETTRRTLHEIRDRLARAERAIAPLELTEASELVAGLSSQLDDLEARLHRARVRCALDPRLDTAEK